MNHQWNALKFHSWEKYLNYTVLVDATEQIIVIIQFKHFFLMF